MSSKILSTANPSLHLHYSKPNQSSTKSISSVSFSSHVSNSRISTGHSSRPRMAQSTARTEAFYSPADSRETLYELLGISETVSSFSDIKKAYKQMARKYHPDVSPPDRVDENTQRFIQVHEAYETLSDPQTRAMYDRALAGGFGFSFSKRKSDQEMEEREEWRSTWESQLDELNRRDSRGNTTSWGARMRSQR